ncbi:unnamed protein product [Lepeophtheirus salmonis]|uniref:(salmon louse) hypothetical protein n=1 Tax=Lepeophtheirus salmonis TaxID=72036 RepID=A0A7R8CTU5_LEPSM|nr:unnamed protein product [Lepeophtheirus salmonis]CAF2929426.1 unnamed protein product [Lepeophtheirus salmonis]
MDEETMNSVKTTSDVREKKGILKNKPKDDKRVPVNEPLIVPEKAHALCPTENVKDSTCAPNSNPNNISDNTTREFLIQKRSSLTHTPDITRIFSANAQKLSCTSESLHEFQKVKLRHVDNTAGGILSPETIRKADERRKSSKDIIIDLSPAPIKYNNDSGNIKDINNSMDDMSSLVSSRKTSYENNRSFGERSSSFTQVLSRGSSFKRESIPREMSTSMYSPSTASTTDTVTIDGMTDGTSTNTPSSASKGKKSLITRGGSSSSLKRNSDEKKPSIIRESKTKTTSTFFTSSSGAPVNQVIKRNNSGVEAKEDNKKKSNLSSTTTNAKTEINKVAKKPASIAVSKAMTTSSSKENKKPVNSYMKKDENKGPSTKNDKKPLSSGNNDRGVRKSPSFKKSSTSPVTTKTTGPKKIADTKVKQNVSSRDNKNSADMKKTPEVRRRVVQKPSTVVRDAMRSKARQSPSPSLRRKAPSPTLQPTKKLEPKKKHSDTSNPTDKESDKSEESTKRPERVSGVFRPTQSWLCYMGDKVDIKSHTPSPGLKVSPPTPGMSRKRSGGGSGERKSSAPVRRTESFDKKKSTSRTPSETNVLKRSSSLRSNREVSTEAQLKRPSLKKNHPPPVLPKPAASGRTLPVAVSSLESADTQDSGIEETSIKASSVIQKFEAVKGSSGGTSILGSPESGSGEKVSPHGSEEMKQDSTTKFASNKTPRSSLVPSSNLSAIMVTNEEYSSQRMQSHSRSGSIASGGDNGSTTNGNGYQSAEKYKTTMVVRLHPGQTRKLSNCSTTTAELQSPLSNSGSFCRDDGMSSSSRKYSTISNSSIGSVSSLTTSSLTQQHRYSADIHGSDCEKGDNTSCCASGLEITFESPPQTIDIKLIPSPSVEERKTIENDEEGNNNLISQEQTDKTRQ